MRKKLALTLAAAGWTLGVSSWAEAQVPACPTHTGDPAEMEQKGRALFDEALRREPADPRAALEILTCVQRIADKPAVSLRVGTIAERLSMKRLAVESFERYLALAGSAAPDRADMQRHIDELRAELARAPATSRDKGPEPTPQAPAVEPEPAHATLWPAYVTLAAGGVLVIAGGAFLWSAKSRNDDVHDLEPGKSYWNSADAKGEMDTARREQTIGIVGLGVGFATIGVGTWLFWDQKSRATVAASVTPHAGQASLRLRF
ncbi:MAG: hypothetical protein U0263_37640 [Polyangiaceae bacterium]